MFVEEKLFEHGGNLVSTVLTGVGSLARCSSLWFARTVILAETGYAFFRVSKTLNSFFPRRGRANIEQLGPVGGQLSDKQAFFRPRVVLRVLYQRVRLGLVLRVLLFQ